MGNCSSFSCKLPKPEEQKQTKNTNFFFSLAYNNTHTCINAIYYVDTFCAHIHTRPLFSFLLESVVKHERMQPEVSFLRNGMQVGSYYEFGVSRRGEKETMSFSPIHLDCCSTRERFCLFFLKQL